MYVASGKIYDRDGGRETDRQTDKWERERKREKKGRVIS